jgi:hypothetical protein
MTVLNPHIAFALFVTCAVGYLMVVAGLHKSALERKTRRRACPSCGRLLHERVCPRCSSA